MPHSVPCIRSEEVSETFGSNSSETRILSLPSPANTGLDATAGISRSKAPRVGRAFNAPGDTHGKPPYSVHSLNQFLSRRTVMSSDLTFPRPDVSDPPCNAPVLRPAHHTSLARPDPTQTPGYEHSDRPYSFRTADSILL